MKFFFLPVLLFAASNAFSQYYYKDIIGTKETADLIATYKANKVSSVVVNTYDGNNQRLEDFVLLQRFSPANSSLVTVTKSVGAHPSVLITYVDDAGRILRAVDSSSGAVNSSVYSYLENGKLASILSTSADRSKNLNESELHLWQYNGDQLYRMLRIKNKIDTTFVEFKLDEKGNVVEEVSRRKGNKAEPVYYYYDDQNRLTDIVRFNSKAKRLLPEYMFEYSPSNKVIQKITVPGNGSDYIIWRSQFDQRGLKTKEAIYNKYKELTGKVEYQYSFAP